MLHIINACFVGKFGLADYTLSLARALSRHAHSEIVTAQDFDYPDVPFDGTITRLFRRTRNYPVDLVRFFVYVLRKKPDALILQSCLKIAFVDAVLVRLLRSLGVRVFATVHDFLPHHPKPWSKLEYAFFYRSFDGLIAHSKDTEEQLVGLGVKAPILVVPHGVYDIYKLNELSKTEARRRLNIRSNDFIALFFGKVDSRKGVEFLVELIKQNMLDSDVKIIFAGMNGLSNSDGGLRSDFESILACDNCISVVKEIPFSDVEVFFQACDVVLLPYKEGTTSGVLKLAVAFERPVIASRIGDIPSNVRAGTGVLFDMENPVASIASAIDEVRSNYGSYADCCREAGSEYSWVVIGQKYYDFSSRT